ncbi:kinase-like domain-containing protein [Fusarium tricinctum]|uniref:non-specific serine/threonine protein kinase n=1 Tax=Fusarium tricinctum TaxID=61284 RepID=A0A8K0W8U0_9HYPO|nr:kinase-like domain-containing protein [Fusarium tricinctum]
MGDWARGWTRVGQTGPTQHYGRVWEAERELEELNIIDSWNNDDSWPGINKPLFNGPDAKRFDTKLAKLDDLGYGAFGRVEKVSYGSVYLARKRIPRRRGFTIEDLRKESLTMQKLDHRHVVKLVATYAPRTHELCLLIWPAAICNLSTLLEDIEYLRLGEGDRDDILERLDALDIKDLSAIEPSAEDQILHSTTKCPLEFLRNAIGCIARAMAYCHQNDVRHLDIKPSNILLKADRVYLADFGVSRDVSGQDQTMTEGVPGTERWRAPELYADNGSSMQLSDIYSLGLVFLNIATVLYNIRLADFDETLRYPSRNTQEEQLYEREKKLNVHLEKLTSHALVTPPFMFTYEGQETVRPRPIVGLIARMITPNPKNRLHAYKIDDKLSMLGGIHQIYHGECCKRPISWVEDKWDKKLTALMSLRKENDRLQQKVNELEGRDRTYELRLEHERKAHEQAAGILQKKLQDMEDRCRALEADNSNRRSSIGRASGRTAMPRPCRSSTTSLASGPRLESSPKSNSTPATPAARPALQPWSRSTQRLPLEQKSSSLQRKAVSPRPPNDITPRGSTEFSTSRSPNFTNMSGYTLRSRGSGSKLPLPVTPSRNETPNLTRDQSLTDSSMASSVFSRHSVETTPTPLQGSPALDRNPAAIDSGKLPQWGQLPKQPARSKERVVTPEPLPLPTEPNSPTFSMPLSAMSSPRTLRSELASIDGDETRRPSVPSFQSFKSWAEVANEGKKTLKMITRPRAHSNRSNRQLEVEHV